MLIPLNQLELSGNNVRTYRNPDSIAELAAQIHAQGLIHRLSVTRLADDRFAVEAGGRRLAALQQLLADGKIDANDMIECRLYDTAQALEISIAENSHEAMHPADQFLAFAKLIEAGLTETEVAHRFGVTPLTVKRRMVLAKLAPCFIDLYRAAKISMEQLQALCLCDDQEKQIAVWNALPPYNNTAYTIRAAIMQDSMTEYDRLAVFAGLDAYTAGGGAVRCDLFAEDRYIEDPELMRELAAQRLDRLADALRAQGWPAVDTTLHYDWNTRSAYIQKFGPVKLAPNEEEDEAIADIEQQIEAVYEAVEQFEENIGDEYGDEESDKMDWYRGLTDALEDFKDEMLSCLDDWHDAQEQGAMVVIGIGHDGELEMLKGVVRRAEAGTATSGQSSYGESASKPKVKAEFSEKLMTSLTAHRTAAVQAALLEQPRIALALLTSRLADKVFGKRYYTPDSPTKISIDVTDTDTLERQASGYTSTTAHSHLISEIASCRALYAEAKNFKSTLAWCMQLSDDTFQKIVACCVSQSINMIASRQTTMSAEESTLLELLNFNMADWWQADETNYFSSVSKVQIIEAITEGANATAAVPVAAMKKAEAAKYAAAKIAGARWLPKALRMVMTDAD